MNLFTPLPTPSQPGAQGLTDSLVIAILDNFRKMETQRNTRFVATLFESDPGYNKFSPADSGGIEASSAVCYL